MNARFLSLRSGAVAAVVAAALGFATPASSGFFSFSSVPGGTAGGQPVSAQVDFTTSLNQISLTLTNLQANPVSIIQAISDLFFVASNDGTALTGGTGLKDPTASYINIFIMGVAASRAIAGQLESHQHCGTYHLDKLCGIAAAVRRG